MRSRVCVTLDRPSVRLSVGPVDRQQQWPLAGLLLSDPRARGIDRQQVPALSNKPEFTLPVVQPVGLVNYANKPSQAALERPSQDVDDVIASQQRGCVDSRRCGAFDRMNIQNVSSSHTHYVPVAVHTTGDNAA